MIQENLKSQFESIIFVQNENIDLLTVVFFDMLYHAPHTFIQVIEYLQTIFFLSVIRSCLSFSVFGKPRWCYTFNLSDN